MKRFRLWLRLARAQYTPPILAAVAVGTAYAAYDARPVRVLPAALALLGAFFAHLGANVLNDIFDHLAGADAAAEATRTSRDFGGSGVLTAGEATLAEAWAVAGGAWALAVLCGLALVPFGGSTVLVLGAVGFALALLYGMPPVALAYLGRGLGEAAVFVAFGPLPVMGAYVAQAGEMSSGALLASLPSGFYTTAILYDHHFTHPDGDAAVGKMSPVVTLGETRALAGCVALPLLAYASIAAGVAFGEFPRGAYVSFLTALPMGWTLAKLGRTNTAETYMGLTRATAALSTATALLFAASLLAPILSRG